MEGIWSQLTREDLPEAGMSGCSSCYRVILSRRITTSFCVQKTLGFSIHHLSDSNVAGCLLIEGGGDNLPFDGASHIGNFFGALINQEHH